MRLGNAGLGNADLGNADLGDAGLGNAGLGNAGLGNADLAREVFNAGFHEPGVPRGSRSPTRTRLREPR
jgi:uncharacterized protein YjbI with pentapeptide repeats